MFTEPSLEHNKLQQVLPVHNLFVYIQKATINCDVQIKIRAMLGDWGMYTQAGRKGPEAYCWTKAAVARVCSSP